MSKLITGLHHITAIASDAQANVDFYAGILGLRMVKKTINFDAPEVYHLYYGNENLKTDEQLNL
jgi:glyoxalase family protein